MQETLAAAAIVSTDNLSRLAIIAARSNSHAAAYDYFTRVLEVDADNTDAWVGKASAAGWLSNDKQFRIDEMVHCFASALETAPTSESSRVRELASGLIPEVITQYYNRLRRGYSPAFAESDSWSLYVSRLRDLVEAMDQARKLLPESCGILQTGLHIFGDNLGRLDFVRRNDAVPAHRFVPDDLFAMLVDRQEQYTQALHRIAPELTPTVIRPAARPGKPKPNKGLTPLQWLLILLGVLFLLLLLNQTK